MTIENLSSAVSESATTTDIVTTTTSPTGHSKFQHLQAVARRRRVPVKRTLFPHTTESGKLFGTTENLETLLQAYGIVARYNVIKKDYDFLVPELTSVPDNYKSAALAEITSLAALNGFPVGNLDKILQGIAARNPYNPAAEWITSRPWDGRERLCDFFDTVQVSKNYPVAFRNVLLRKWLLSAVAAACSPTGFRTRGVLTLQGAQRQGKTSWILSLVNDPVLRPALIKGDHLLDPNNKDSVLGAISHWIVEIGELDGSLRRADIAAMKGFLTRDQDKIRRPYAVAESDYARRTVFCATVNDSNFLVDSTGNSRFWTIATSSLNYTHDIDMQQVFAQIYEQAFLTGQQWWLTPEEDAQLDAINGSHQVMSPIQERVTDAIDHSRKPDPQKDQLLGPGQLLHILGYKTSKTNEARECGAVLRGLFGDPHKIVHNTNKWFVPLRKDLDVLIDDFVAVDDDPF